MKTKQSATQAKQTKQAAFNDQVENLLIYHLDESITTPNAVLPGNLENFDIADRFETTDSPEWRATYEALIASKSVPDPDSDFDAQLAPTPCRSVGAPRRNSVTRVGLSTRTALRPFKSP